VLQVGKREVDIVSLDQVGNYAVRPVFSDGHDTGIYSWDQLYLLGRQHDTWWPEYLRRLEAAGASRDGLLNPPQAPKSGGSCGHHPH
jgi:DUF971 family protein